METQDGIFAEQLAKNTFVDQSKLVSLNGGDNLEGSRDFIFVHVFRAPSQDVVDVNFSCLCKDNDSCNLLITLQQQI